MAEKKFSISMEGCDLFMSSDDKIIFSTKEGRLFELKEVVR